MQGPAPSRAPESPRIRPRCRIAPVAQGDGSNSATRSTKESCMTKSQEHIAQVERASAHNYHPLPIVVSRAEGVWVHDVDGKRYMDMLAAYSAVNFGHGNPELLAAAKAQL